MPDWKKYRNLFPATRKLVFLNHAAMSPLSLRIMEKIREYTEDIRDFGEKKWRYWQGEFEKTRELTAQLLNCSSDEIAFCANTTDGMHFVTTGLDWKKGDNVVSVENEFVANYYPWKVLETDGVELKLVPQKNGRFDPEELKSAVNDRTRLITVSWVQFLSGYRAPLEELSDFCRKKGILLALDAIQGLGGLKIDLTDTAIDFLFCGSHKWMLGMLGTGIFYCRKTALKELRLKRLGWMSMEEPFDFFNLTQPLKHSAARFEYASHNQPGVLCQGESIKLFLEIGPEKIEKRIIEITDLLCERLRNLGYNLLSPRDDNEKSGIVSFSGKTDMKQLFDKLTDDNIAVSLREGYIRVSPHFYNSEEDIDKLIRTLEK